MRPEKPDETKFIAVLPLFRFTEKLVPVEVRTAVNRLGQTIEIPDKQKGPTYRAKVMVVWWFDDPEVPDGKTYEFGVYSGAFPTLQRNGITALTYNFEMSSWWLGRVGYYWLDFLKKTTGWGDLAKNKKGEVEWKQHGAGRFTIHDDGNSWTLPMDVVDHTLRKEIIRYTHEDLLRDQEERHYPEKKAARLLEEEQRSGPSADDVEKAAKIHFGRTRNITI